MHHLSFTSAAAGELSWQTLNKSL